MARGPDLYFRSVPSPREIEWTRILDRWKQIGLGGPTFCRREGLSQPQFYSWKRKLRLRDEAKVRRPGRKRLEFVPVELKPSSSSAPLELALAGGGMVRQALGQDPLSGSLFVFANKSRARIKILFFDRTGFVLWHKRLETGLFQFPSSEAASLPVEAAQLALLLDG